MKFNLVMSANFLPKDQIKKYEELGFVFDDPGGGFYYKDKKRCKKEPIKTIEINSLDELIAFVNNFGGCVIIDTDYKTENTKALLEIYNDYRE